jgi:hypothetical protein
MKNYIQKIKFVYLFAFDSLNNIIASNFDQASFYSNNFLTYSINSVFSDCF